MKSKIQKCAVSNKDPTNQAFNNLRNPEEFQQYNTLLLLLILKSISHGKL